MTADQDASSQHRQRDIALSRSDACFLSAAAIVALITVACMLALSPDVPFADAWRHYARLLQQPFPSNVLSTDNGHAEIFANLVRYADLRWFDGGEWLQTLIGASLALAAVGALLAAIRRASATPVGVRCAAAFVATLGVFWLGNARALLHNNETLHAYSVLACVALAAWTASRTTTLRSTLLASVLCAGAAFCFGSGLAAFAAMGAILFVDRAPLRRWLCLALVGIATVLLYEQLPHAANVASEVDAVAAVPLALRWIATPGIYLAWPFVDPAAAAGIPQAIAAPFALSARAWTSTFGDVHTSVWPQLGVGCLYAGALVAMTLGARRAPADRVRVLGLALAWFGMGVAGLIGLTRAHYFAEFPAQLHAPRYLPWSSIGWAGLLMAWISTRPGRPARLASIWGIAALSISGGAGMTLVMLHQRADALDTAIAAVVGIVDPSPRSSENDPNDVRRGADALRRAGKGPFAWPEARAVGEDVPAGAIEHPGDVPNERAPYIEATIDGAIGAPRLVVACEGTIVGLVRHLRGRQWRGAVRACPSGRWRWLELPSHSVAAMPPR